MLPKQAETTETKRMENQQNINQKYMRKYFFKMTKTNLCMDYKSKNN